MYMYMYMFVGESVTVCAWSHWAQAADVSKPTTNHYPALTQRQLY